MKNINWNNISLKKQLALIKHNEQLINLYNVDGKYFAVNAFVKCKNNGFIRHITKHNGKTFEDNGQISGCEPSPNCHYENYEMI